MTRLVTLLAKLIYCYGIHGAQMASFHGGYETPVPNSLKEI